MKKLIIILGLLVPFALFSQNAIFLHHSTGGGVWNGGVSQWISNYNASNSTSYQAVELAYPNSPYPWENYAYDFWNLWCNQQCNSSNANIECLNTLTSKYKLIIIKHCFPGASVGADGTPDITSKSKTIANYKLQYRALRAKFDSFPSNKFMVWTLAPLHRLSTNAADAARAKQFVDWVKTEWLTEDGKSHPNIYIFDFYGYAAESNPTPTNGQVNCLKYEYEGSHSDGDSHPNNMANTTIAPFFAQAIVDALKDTSTQKYTVTFEVKEATAALSGVSVAFNSQVMTTDGSGKAIFNNVSKGDLLSYTISKASYTSQTGSANIAKDTTIKIELVKPNPGTYTLTFMLKEGSAALSGVKVTFNSATITTDATGKAVFSNVSPGTAKSYTISKSGYVSQTNTLTVSKNDTIDIVLVKSQNAASVEDLKMDVYPNPCLDILQVNTNSVISMISLCSLTGTLIKKWTNINTNTLNIDVSDVQAGYYLLSISSKDNTNKTIALVKR